MIDLGFLKKVRTVNFLFFYLVDLRRLILWKCGIPEWFGLLRTLNNIQLQTPATGQESTVFLWLFERRESFEWNNLYIYIFYCKVVESEKIFIRIYKFRDSV